jgi:hypothetical protein
MKEALTTKPANIEPTQKTWGKLLLTQANPYIRNPIDALVYNRRRSKQSLYSE